MGLLAGVAVPGEGPLRAAPEEGAIIAYGEVVMGVVGVDGIEFLLLLLG